MSTDVETDARNMIALPDNRVIRRRVAARTTAIHASALADEPWASEPIEDRDGDGYLRRHQFPDQILLEGPEGESRALSRDQAWRLADEKAEALEWSLSAGLAGRIAGFFSKHGQGIYANYGRPTMDFSGFFRDRIAGAGGKGAQGVNAVRLGPVFIAIDTASAAGFTALGHVSRRADLMSRPVLADVLSTGAYEGTSSWTSAKLGVFTGVKAMTAAALVPLPGARLGALVVGFAVGATTAIVVKRTANRLKDKAIDAAYEGAGRRAILEGEAAPAS